MKKNNLIKGSISIFLIITFVANYLLAALLVDATRVHAAKTEVQAAAEIATQNILTRYDEYLYELYGLFAVTDMDQDAIASSVKDYIDQMVCLGVGEDTSLGKAMAQSVFFDAGIDKAWKPYELDLKVTAGSNVTLASNDVLKSQILDQMKFRAPVQIADSFLDFLDTVGELEEVKDAIEEKNASEEKLQECIDALEKTKQQTKETKNKIINYCVDPVTTKSSSKSGKKAADFVSYMEWMDESLSGIKTSSKENMNRSIDSTYKQFVQKMKNVGYNAKSLRSEINSLLTDYNSEREKFQKIIKELTAKRDEIKNNSNMSDEARNSLVKTYDNDIERAGDCIKQINQYSEKLNNAFKPLDELANYEFSVQNEVNKADTTVKELEDLINSIRFEGEHNSYSLADVVTEEEFSVKSTFWKNGQYTFCAGYFSYVHERLQKALNAINSLEFKDTTEKKVDDTVNSEEEEFMVSGRLGNIPGYAKYTASKLEKASNKGDEALEKASNKGDASLEKAYNKGNAAEKLTGVLDKITGLLSTLGTDIRDNLYINEYAMTYFRSYVHHLKMANDKTIGKDGYDKVISTRYCEQQYIDIETTVSELEYILIGSDSYALNLTGVYAEIMLWRMALNTLSVFMTSDLYNMILTAASPAGVFAPLVVLGVVLVTAATQAALDTQAIMSGKKVNVIRTQIDEWGISVGNNGGVSSNGSAGSPTSTNIKAGYSDYVRLMLLMMPQDTKLQRMGTIINMNMKKVNNGFNIQNTYCNVYANVSVDMGFLLLSPDILNTSLSQPGKYHFDVGVNSAY